VHEPPTVVQEVGGFGVEDAVSLSIRKLTVVPSGAFTNVPVPVSCCTVAVNVWFVPTSFVASNGEIEIFASTTARGSHGPSSAR